MSIRELKFSDKNGMGQSLGLSASRDNQQDKWLN